MSFDVLLVLFSLVSFGHAVLSVRDSGRRGVPALSFALVSWLMAFLSGRTPDMDAWPVSIMLLVLLALLLLARVVLRLRSKRLGLRSGGSHGSR